MAEKEDAGLCYEIINSGRCFQQEQGFMQWTNEYPDQATIREDILSKFHSKLNFILCIINLGITRSDNQYHFFAYME